MGKIKLFGSNKGEGEIEMWNTYMKIGEKINDIEYIEEFKVFIKQKMENIVLNFKIIKQELESNGYFFENIGNINPDYHVLKEEIIGNVDIEKLDSYFSSFGNIPYSFLYFIKYIRNIDFRGSFTMWDNPFYLDAIYLFDINGIMQISDTPFEIEEQGVLFYYLLISPDEFVKENISGDIGYGIGLSRHGRICDNYLVNFPQKVTFIEYLRLNFKWAGLVGLEWYEENEIPNNILNIILSIRSKMTPI